MFDNKKNEAATTNTNAAEKKQFTFGEAMCDYAGLLMDSLLVGSLVVGTFSAIKKAMKNSEEFDKKYNSL